MFGLYVFRLENGCNVWFVCVQVGERLGKFEVEKRQAVENEDYDRAKQKKSQMDEYRMQMYKQLEIENLIEITQVRLSSLLKYLFNKN